MRLLSENVNAAVVLAGFVALESGVAVQWSASVAAIVGGVVLMGLGSWRYVVAGLPRKRT